MIQPCTSLEARIAPIATPIAMTPPVAIDAHEHALDAVAPPAAPRQHVLLRGSGVEPLLGAVPVLTATRLAGPDPRETISIGAVRSGRI